MAAKTIEFVGLVVSAASYDREGSGGSGVADTVHAGPMSGEAEYARAQEVPESGRVQPSAATTSRAMACSPSALGCSGAIDGVPNDGISPFTHCCAGAAHMS
ncbi:hypothetical protein NRB56_31960 [Nocardia sp. RB56]|uniref:Uncharacterized protein n=1 Tax=Nocardia aurantia TaxID=2585199 RepID=A0A7K0DPE4_9NOCA|nr:hypothetical protein [Nocardia aurantia]